MQKIIYLTTNKDKAYEAQEFFGKKLGINIEIMKPDFKLIEIQAEKCADVVAFTVKYAADKIQKPVIKSDAGFYIDALGGLPGPYSTYFDKQIGTEKFLKLMKNEKNRKARIEYSWAYCEPNKSPKVFTDGTIGALAYRSSGQSSRWVDKFFIPEGESETISAIRDKDYQKANSFWGNAKGKLFYWLKENI
jgi:XTP/dITP diphosphohydrolase